MMWMIPKQHCFSALFLLAVAVRVPLAAATEEGVLPSLPDHDRQLTNYVCDMYGYGCPEDRWCDTDELKCYRKRNNGEQCNRDEKCQSNNCVYRECQAAPGTDPCLYTTCPTGTYCDQGICVDDLHCNHDHDCDPDWVCRSANNRCVRCYLDIHCESIGKVCKSYECVECRYDSQCAHGEKCLDLQCVNDQMCYGDIDCRRHNWVCNLQGQCVRCFADHHCNYGEKCEHNQCVDDGLCNHDNECQHGWHCDAYGYCVECYQDSQCPGTQVCELNTCVIGVECTDNGDCLNTEYCNSAGECKPKCYAHNGCGHGYYCDLYLHECHEKLPNWSHCDYHYECESGWCRHRPALPDVCRPKLDNGEECDADVWCQSGFCFNGYCRTSQLPIGDPCNHHYECNSGTHCICTTWTCDYLGGPGAGCSHNCECASNWCNNNHCRSKKGLGETCIGDWQCESGSCDDRDCGTWYGHYHCGSDTCVPIMGGHGDYCTQNYQCKSDRCVNNSCRGHS